MTTNPYESPQGTTAAGTTNAGPAPLTLWSATMYVLLTSGGGLILGGVLGYALGVLAPGYYRTVFPRLTDSGFHPAAMGLVLGGTQGLFGGAVIGLLILAIYAWYLTRAGRPPRERGSAAR